MREECIEVRQTLSRAPLYRADSATRPRRSHSPALGKVRPRDLRLGQSRIVQKSRLFKLALEALATFQGSEHSLPVRHWAPCGLIEMTLTVFVP